MPTETTMFFYTVLRENRPVSDFIDGKYTLVNELLAKHYKIAGVTGSDFRRIELATDQRSGRAHAGKRVDGFELSFADLSGLAWEVSARKCLGSPPPPLPADVPPLDEAAMGTKRSLR